MRGHASRPHSERRFNAGGRRSCVRGRSPRKGAGETCGAGSTSINRAIPRANPLPRRRKKRAQNPPETNRFRQSPPASANPSKSNLPGPKSASTLNLRLRCSQGTLDDARSDPGDRSPGGTKCRCERRKGNESVKGSTNKLDPQRTPLDPHTTRCPVRDPAHPERPNITTKVARCWTVRVSGRGRVPPGPRPAEQAH